MRNQIKDSGPILEKTVKQVLSSKGFEIETYKTWEKDKSKYGKELLLTNAPFISIYGHDGHTEFLLLSEKYNLKTRIECKWQQTSGSVDEKLPYLYLNTIEAMPEDQIMIIIDGAGWKKGAVDWLREAVNKKKYTTQINGNKKIEVFDIKEFLTWANKTFI